MTRQDPDTQETRSESVTTRVTESERRAMQFVAEARGVTVSNLLRETSVQDAVESYARMMRSLGIAA
jgi:hypothetical protein